MTDSRQMTASKRRYNGVIAALCLGFFVGMIGMAYASVPLYRLFCQVTGYGGTTQRADAPTGVVLDKDMTVRFDANTNGIGWEFKPVQRKVTVKIGEMMQVAYRARNRLSTASTGTATFNVTPQAAGAYFNKMECFCFTEQTLLPGEEIDMPIVFFVDPDIVDSPELAGISTITLSYTFFPVDDPKPVAQSGTGAVEETTIR
jgi:cytochrome c oxidase assembly protein subunit 11